MAYQDTIILTVDGTDLDDVILEFTEGTEVPTRVVNTMNRKRRGTGYKSGNTTFNMSARVEVSDDPRIPPWHSWCDTRKEFRITKRPNVGKSVTFDRCRITKIDQTDQDGESTRTLTLLALERDEA
jgi:hypothetical protein